MEKTKVSIAPVWACVRKAIVAYLADGLYPDGYSENEKRVLRRYSKWFVLKNGRTLYHLRDVGKIQKTLEQRTAEAQLVVVGDADKRNIIQSIHTGLGGGQFGVTKTKEYIAVATEYLTQFAVAKAIPNKDAATVGQFIFEDIICMFGIPKILQHDQGREFCNNMSQFMCDKLQIKTAISTAYHPQTNGLTERFNQTVVTQLMKVVNEKHNDWDQHLHTILFAYRASSQASTKKSPLELLVGVKPHLPVDIDNEYTEDEDPCINFNSAVADRMKLISEQLVRTREEGLQNLSMAQ